MRLMRGHAIIGGGGGAKNHSWKAFQFLKLLFFLIAITWLITTSILFIRHHGLTLNSSNSPQLFTTTTAAAAVVNDCWTVMKWPSFKDPLHIEKSALAPLRCSITTVQDDEASANNNNNNKKNKNIKEDIIDMRQLVATLPFDNKDGGAWKQGWDVQPIQVDEQNPLEIFVIPHSHCDPGWIKTFDNYFQTQTRQILSTVYNALMADDRRRFIWAEISYFEWWYREQDTTVQENTKMLVFNKRLEFVTGGWVQPDEANTDLFAIEVQLNEGHDWIRSTFGQDAIPSYHWSIDPFGYSPTMAAILHKYHFKGMLIQRVHYAIKKELARRKHLEFYWRQVWDPTGEHDIFTHVMPFYSYDVPHTCGPDPAVCCQFDFARMHKYGGCPWGHHPQPIDEKNVAARAQLILDQWKKKANLYRSRVVIIPLGDDFRYQDSQEAEAQYTNFQKIFDYLNQNVPGVRAQFGTLSNYFEAVSKTIATPIPVLKGSFFTYADRNEDYWSGYFTSRVFDKALGRRLERSLYAASMMGATKQEMQGPRRSLSLFQHHDGVTGTAKSFVVEDYASKLQTSIVTAHEWMAAKVGSLQEMPIENLSSCYQSQSTPRSVYIFKCDVSQQLYAFNPLSEDQYCGDTTVPALSSVQVREYPCDSPGPVNEGNSLIRFGPNGMMTHPIQEEWNVWHVEEGGAYLFFPHEKKLYSLDNAVIDRNGYSVKTSHWSRTVTEKRIPGYNGENVTVLDFEYETNLVLGNQEWFVRLKAPINNKGVFHTDLNGFNFDTHYFRKDLPTQSQVFPMPTLASIEDATYRLTILSEHAQGTAHLENGAIDIWLDRRLLQDDNRGLGEGVMDNVVTRSKLRILLETDGWDRGSNSEFEITPLCKRMWDELNHPLEIFGTLPV